MSGIEKHQRTLPYPMHVGSAPVKPENVEHWKKSNISPLIEYHSNMLEHNRSKYDTSKNVLDRLKELRFSSRKNSKSIDEIISIQELHHELLKKELQQSIIDQLMLEVIASSEMYHVPAVGTMYHVYTDINQKKFITLIGPTEWKNNFEYLGSFINKKTHFEIFYQL